MGSPSPYHSMSICIFLNLLYRFLFEISILILKILCIINYSYSLNWKFCSYSHQQHVTAMFLSQHRDATGFPWNQAFIILLPLYFRFHCQKLKSLLLFESTRNLKNANLPVRLSLIFLMLISKYRNLSNSSKDYQNMAACRSN